MYEQMKEHLAMWHCIFKAKTLGCLKKHPKPLLMAHLLRDEPLIKVSNAKLEIYSSKDIKHL